MILAWCFAIASRSVVRFSEVGGFGDAFTRFLLLFFTGLVQLELGTLSGSSFFAGIQLELGTLSGSSFFSGFRILSFK
jgi:hypothetical protein